MPSIDEYSKIHLEHIFRLRLAFAVHCAIIIGDESWVVKLERREVRVFESKGFSKNFISGVQNPRSRVGAKAYLAEKNIIVHCNVFSEITSF